MTSSSSLEARSAMFDASVVPLLMPDEALSGPPELVLLGGAPGAGASRAVGRLRAEFGAGTAVIRAGELAAFIPDRNELQRQGSDCSRELAEAAGEWVRASLRLAREQKRSVILDGGVRSPEVIAGLVRLYRADGYQTRLIVVAARRADALLTELSTHLDAVWTGDDDSIFSPDPVTVGLEETRAVMKGVVPGETVDRVFVLDRRGDVAFDSDRDEAPWAASGVLAELESAPMRTQEAVAWLGELKRTAAFAESRRVQDVAVTDVLIELYEHAVHEVIPRLAVNASATRGAEVLSVQEHAAAARLVSLRRSRAATPSRVDATGPVVSGPGPSAGGPSR